MKKKVISCLIMFAIITSFFTLYESPAYAANTIYAEDIVSTAKDLVGKYPYVWGGYKPEDGGFDCTGLVYYIYHTQLGYDMSLSQARSKAKLLEMGEKISSKSELLPGDIVQYTIAHVGIYIGNNTVVHAGLSSGVQKISINTSALTFNYGIRLSEISQGAMNSPAINNGDGNFTISSTPASISTESGIWTVTIPDNYKLVCYTSANATKSSPNYISAKTEPYRLTCTQQATLSNGKVRYFFTSGDGKNLWFDYTNGMSAVSSGTNPAKPYTVTFNANGGSVGQSSKTVTNGQRYGDLPMPSLDGYSFDGWFTSANGGTLVTAATTVNLTGNQTLYAHWSKNKETYTIFFDPDGGSVDINSKEVNYGEYYGELPTPYRDGYKFEGWRTGRNGTGSLRSSEKKVTTKSDETLYAHWSPIDTRIRVHFDTNGGPDHGYLFYYEANDTYGTLPSTEWVGYTFDGWYTLANGGTKISSSTKLIQNSEHTLFAHWTKEEEIEPSTLTISGLKVTVSGGKIRASATVTSNYDLMDYSYSNGAAGGGLGSVGKNRKTFEYTYEVDYTNLAYDGAGTYTFWLTCTDMSGNSVTATYDYYLPGKNTPQYFSCNVGIFTIKGKTVNLYNNPGDSKRVDYFDLGQSVGSSYGVNMPDGTTWYQVSVTSKGNVITVWLKYESDKMTIRNL